MSFLFDALPTLCSANYCLPGMSGSSSAGKSIRCKVWLRFRLGSIDRSPWASAFKKYYNVKIIIKKCYNVKNNYMIIRGLLGIFNFGQKAFAAGYIYVAGDVRRGFALVWLRPAPYFPLHVGSKSLRSFTKTFTRSSWRARLRSPKSPGTTTKPGRQPTAWKLLFPIVS